MLSHQGAHRLSSLDYCRFGLRLLARLSELSLMEEASSSENSPRSSRLEDMGCRLMTTSAATPQHNANVERHGGMWK
eukprot:723760-Pyramimonas_sp.AAC.1